MRARSAQQLIDSGLSPDKAIQKFQDELKKLNPALAAALPQKLDVPKKSEKYLVGANYTKSGQNLHHPFNKTWLNPDSVSGREKLRDLQQQGMKYDATRKVWEIDTHAANLLPLEAKRMLVTAPPAPKTYATADPIEEQFNTDYASYIQNMTKENAKKLFISMQALSNSRGIDQSEIERDYSEFLLDPTKETSVKLLETAFKNAQLHGFVPPPPPPPPSGGGKAQRGGRMIPMVYDPVVVNGTTYQNKWAARAAQRGGSYEYHLARKRDEEAWYEPAAQQEVWYDPAMWQKVAAPPQPPLAVPQPRVEVEPPPKDTFMQKVGRASKAAAKSAALAAVPLMIEALIRGRLRMPAKPPAEWRNSMNHGGGSAPKKCSRACIRKGIEEGVVGGYSPEARQKPIEIVKGTSVDSILQMLNDHKNMRIKQILKK